MRKLALMVAVIFGVALLGSVAFAGGVIKIGALYNLTGGMSSIDAPALNGAKLAVKQVNAKGGVLGKKIEIVAIDTKTNQKEAAVAARKLISEGVVACIGYGDTTYVLAAAPLFQKAKIPFVTSGATHPGLPKMVGDYMFLTPFGDNVQAYAMAEFLIKDLGLKKAWVFTNKAMDFTLALSKFFKERFKKLGGKIVLEDFYVTSDKDFSAQIARLKNLKEKPDVLFVSATPDNAGVIVKQIREAGIWTVIASGDGFDTPVIIEVPGPKLADKIYYTTHQSWDNPAPEVQNFIKAYEKTYGRKPENAFAALGYDAAMLVIRAIERAGSTDPKKIKEALEHEKGYKGVTGVISFTPKNHVPVKDVAIMGVVKGKVKFVKMVKPSM